MDIRLSEISLTAGQLERYCRNNRLSFISSILVSAALLVAMWAYLPHESLLAWVDLLLLAQGGQYWYSMRYLRTGEADEWPQSGWMPGLMVASIATGLAWGSSFFILGLNDGQPVAVLMIFVIAGITAYAAVAKSDLFPLAIAFEASALLPTCAWLFMQDGQVAHFMGIIALLYLLLLNILLRQISSMVRRVHSLANDNSSLVAAQALDISERKKTLERLEQAQTIAKLGSWDWDVLANRVEWSEMAYEIYSPDERPEHPSFEEFKQSLHPDDLERVVAAVTSAFEKDTPFDLEHRVVSESRGVRTVHAQGKVFRNEEGQPIRMMGTVQDITERKYMEAEIAAREQEFRSLAESSPDFIMRVDREHNIRYLNDHLARFMGFDSAAEVSSILRIERWHDERGQAMLAAEAEAMQSGKPCSVEFDFPQEDGLVGYHHILVVPERDADGNIIGSIAFGRDMTNMKRMELALTTREQEFRSLAESSPDYIIRYDLEHRILYLNKVLAELLGLSSTEAVIGKRPTAVWPDGRFAQIEEAAAQAIASGEMQLIELAVPDERGQLIYNHIYVVPECDTTGKIVGTIAFGRDISERKVAEQELAEREAFLNSLLDAIPIPVFYKDQEGKYLGINRAFEHFFGASREQLIGKSVFDTHPKELAETYHAKDLEVLERKVERQEYEFQIKHSNGTLRDVWFSKAAFADANDQVKGLIGAVMDITARKQNEVAMEEMRQRLQTVVQTIPDLVWLKDVNGVYLSCNSAFERFFGASETAIVGKTDYDFVDKELADFFRQKDQDAIVAGGMSINEEWVTMADSGEHVLLETRKVPVYGAEGRVVGVLGVGRDITARKRMEEELRRSEYEFRALVENLPEPFFRYDRDHRRTYVNAQVEKLTGKPAASLLGLTVKESKLASPYWNDVLDREVQCVLDTGEPSRYAMDYQTPEGEFKYFDCWLGPVSDEQGETNSVMLILRDTTERKLFEMKLAEREREFRTLVENSADTVARYDRDLRRVYANPAFGELVEGGVEALIGKRPSEVPGGEGGLLNEEKLHQVLASGEAVEFELKWMNKAGQDVYSLINLTPEFDEEGDVASVLAVGRDITELYAFRQKIHRMAFYDPLTSLPNRALFNDRLRQMIADASWHGQLAGVMMIDMDRFKTVNDTMGHAVGDELLRETGARLSTCVRAYDTVARLGGDEFAVLLPDIRNGDDLGTIADKMRSVFDTPFLLEGKEVFISCSIGIALYPGDSVDAEDLVKYADSAMYYAKRSGRNNFRFYANNLTESANERLTLESELRHALERNEFSLHFQPKVCLETGAMIGSEALLRWLHPQRGFLPPDKFIPIAEDSGLIVELGEWVLREACRMASEMNGVGRSLHKVAINLSARQFMSNDLVSTVTRVLEETGCRPEWIELEITESLLLDEYGDVLETLKAFCVLGITIAIDDFGTGYSALSYLARFPINTLKIDRSFINTVTTDKYCAELVKAILSIAYSLGQQVVAEGVETFEQALFLQTHNCEVAQGYLFSKPVPWEELLALSGNYELKRPNGSAKLIRI